MASDMVSGAVKVMTHRTLQPSKSLLYLTLVGAALLRLGVVLYTDAFSLLQDRPELSTTFSSFKSLMETHYLFRHPPTPVSTLTSHMIADPYSAGTVHHSPLFLPLLNHAIGCMHSVGNRLPVALIWTAADLLSGWLLFCICHASEVEKWTKQTHLFAWDRSRAVKVAAIFLFNPYTVATCIASSTVTLEITALLATIYAAISGSAILLAFWWAVSSLLSLYPVLLFPMLIQLCRRMSGELVYQREIARIGKTTSSTGTKVARQVGFLVDRVRSAKRFAVLKCLILMPTALAGGMWLSRAIALSPGNASTASILLNFRNVLKVPLQSGWAWAEQVYGSVIFATDLTPNLGLWWYFFMEIFDHFRDFFLLTFNVHLACYVLPFSIKYKQDPLFGITLMTGVMAVFKSYPTMGDHAVFLGLLSLHSQIFEFMRYPLVSTLTYAYCTCLSPAFHHLWLNAGSANANFFYAITLVWALGGGMLVLDAMWAWGRERWEKERTPIRSHVQHHVEQIDADVSVEIRFSDGARTADKVLAQNDGPRRRVVVQQ
ncbi:related to GPI - transamidase subunit [Melanopsichium pennsylvanicum]|uniref:Related to GPI - transamidase subunit n=2 Tax=Melanopsichium pennsylvanicum TaxID=63383 RepID=A0AAJ5C4U6_9BASI|nr:related to GPI-transamidase subunit [Melanopsichium pennsylvanicum 4]SNX84047.1 related to GPI - transamidase subunit [Melanopsichium pennsylvanicum]